MFFEHFPALSKRDGSFECTVIYANLSSAQLACKLSGTELGDRCFEVRLEEGMKRFDADFIKEAAEPSSRTLLIRSESEDFVEELQGVCRSLALERSNSAEKRHFFLVEFESLAAAVEAWKASEDFVDAVGALQLPRETIGASTIKSPIEEVMIYGVPASKLLETRPSAPEKDNSRSTIAHSNGQSRSRSRSRSRDRYRHRSSGSTSYNSGHSSRHRSRSPRRDDRRDRDYGRDRDERRDKSRDEKERERDGYRYREDGNYSRRK